jgi:hypothetical protein
MVDAGLVRRGGIGRDGDHFDTVPAGRPGYLDGRAHGRHDRQRHLLLLANEERTPKAALRRHHGAGNPCSEDQRAECGD